MKGPLRRNPLQNRVDPCGTIQAVSARGTLMGNRGGRIHDPTTKTLTKRRWATKAWISCLTSFKDRHRPVMGDGYTELFFLDEVTALAAGHRPCFYCRRQAAKAFQSAWQQAQDLPKVPNVGVMDPILHTERLQKDHHPISRDNLVSGSMVVHEDAVLALKDNHLLVWSFEGYRPSSLSVSDLPSTVSCLTPPCIMDVLANGYEPVWHETAS